VKILLIGNYPPPVCGWGIQTRLVADELRRRGHVCDVLKINENRKVKSEAYIDVQGGFDFLRKLALHALGGFRINVDLNAKSAKGYALALIAVGTARLMNRRASVIFRGGVPQRYFPRPRSPLHYLAFRLLFVLANAIACDDENVRTAIQSYGIRAEKVTPITPFSTQYMSAEPAALTAQHEAFLDSHGPVWLSYVCFREEYTLPALRRCLSEYRARYPKAGFIWAGFPEREFAQAQRYVDSWSTQEQEGLLLCGNLDHNQFLALMKRCCGYLRTPACDGVAASVLEALALHIPVVASENNRRPAGAFTYRDGDALDMCAKLITVTQNRAMVIEQLAMQPQEDNVARMADWLTAPSARTARAKIARAT
jgi:glycosyltransferase involved in cell wall biosynthesis